MVDRCVCVDITFEALKQAHLQESLDLEALKQRTGCCSGCNSCEPYVRLMLRTGQTRFPVLSPKEAAHIMLT